MAFEQKDSGAFWWATDKQTGQPKTTKRGDKYMTGKITIGGKTVNATLFYNKNKENPRSPDISISINEKQGTSGNDEIRVEDIQF